MLIVIQVHIRVVEMKLKWFSIKNIYLKVLFVFQMMDAIKGTMTEIYNDLSKNTTGSTIAEVSVRLTRSLFNF